MSAVEAIAFAGSDPRTKSDLDTSVGKALALLSAFDQSENLGVSELARRVGVPKSTAFRLLAILQDWKLVERDGSRYLLGSKLFELGNQVAFCRPQHLREVAQPFLQELYELRRETVHLAVLEGSDVVYLDKVFGKQATPTPSRIGGRLPAHCSAIGKAMLAFADVEQLRSVLKGPLDAMTRYSLSLPRLLVQDLARIRKNGVAFDREEAHLGLTCVAAPVIESDGTVVAAVSMCGTTGRFTPDEYVWAVRRAAAGISQLFNDHQECSHDIGPDRRTDRRVGIGGEGRGEPPHLLRRGSIRAGA